MNTRNRVISTVCLAVAAIFISTAPVHAGDLFEVDIWGTGALPQGKFDDQVDTMPGVDVQGFYRLPSLPLSIGIELGYLIYGSEHRTEPFSESIPDVKVRVSHYNQLVRTGIVLRVEQQFGRVNTHLDGAVGLHHLFTTASIEDRDFHLSRMNSTLERDSATAFGIGGGIGYEVYRHPDDKATILLGAQARYTWGGSADYLTEGDVTITGQNDVITSVNDTNTDMLDVRLGCAVRF